MYLLLFTYIPFFMLGISLGIFCYIDDSSLREEGMFHLDRSLFLAIFHYRDYKYQTLSFF